MKILRNKIQETILENFGEEKHIEKNHSPEGFEQKEKKPSFKVVFDKSTEKPWTVLFTERGFLVGGNTRLSFENVEMAIHKNYNIVLDQNISEWNIPQK